MKHHPLVIGHRGAMGHVLENTLEGFLQAVHLGADAIEMDVQFTRDQEVIVFHDSDLRRITGTRGLVASMPWTRIHKLDERIPLFSDVVALLKPLVSHRGEPVQLIVELKEQATVKEGKDLARAVCDQLKRWKVTERTSVISFQHEYLSVLDSKVQRGILFSRRLKDAPKRASNFEAGFLFPRKDRVTKVLVRKAHEADLGVFTWTANSRREFKRLIRLGVDGIITDYPDRLAKSLPPSVGEGEDIYE